MLSAEEHKILGNKSFKENKFDTSILEYTNAIAKDPTNPLYYSNRSMAFIKNKNYQSAYADACKGLQKLNVNSEELLKSKLEYRRDLAKKEMDIENQTDNIRAATDETRADFHPIIAATTEITDRNSDYILNIQSTETIPPGFLNSQYEVTLTTPTETTSDTIDSGHKVKSDIRFPESPTVQYLTSLFRKPPADLPQYYEYILQLDPAIFQDLFRSSGIESSVLNLYIDACIWDLDKDYPQYTQDMFQTIESFTKLPRFSLSSMFIPSKSIKELHTKMQSKINKDLRSIWR